MMLTGTAFEKLQASLSRYCRYLAGSPWDAEDLYQDVWLKALETVKSPGHPNPEAYLLRIAKNTWMDRARRTGALVRVLDRLRTEQPAAHSDPDPFELEYAFHALLRHLSPLQRAVFLLRDVLGCPAAEAAARLGTTEGAVKAALHRARQSLEAVRTGLRREEPAPPSDDGTKCLLRALCAAYRAGDIARLVDLALLDVVEPAAAIGAVQIGLLRSSRPQRRPDTGPAMQMAA